MVDETLLLNDALKVMENHRLKFVDRSLIKSATVAGKAAKRMESRVNILRVCVCGEAMICE